MKENVLFQSQSPISVTTIIHRKMVSKRYVCYFNDCRKYQRRAIMFARGCCSLILVFVLFDFSIIMCCCDLDEVSLDKFC